ncbi:MAG TPA: ornithine cyclodeaminase family protein [Geminicoccaceae bacterium]|nr:ornithine cyclodeaminase family protein [Geminicoccaceae bacterium]
MKLGEHLLYLSRADVLALDIDPEAARTAVEGVLVRKAAGGVRNAPKLNVLPGDGRLFQAMIALADEPALAATKVVGLAADNDARGLPHISALIVLSDAASGVPVALMDASWITAVRTAAMTAVAARRLARPDAAGIGFVACGVQARSHLAALRPLFALREVRAYGRRPETAKSFAAEARALGLAAEAVADPRDAVTGLDIVITSVPSAPGLVPFLNPDWLAPGSFAALVDLGRSWLPEGLGRIGRRAVDDHEQTAQGGGKLAYRGPFDADLTELAAGLKPGRQSADERAMFIFQGLAAADLAVAALVYGRARQRGLGAALLL